MQASLLLLLQCMALESKSPLHVNVSSCYVLDLTHDLDVIAADRTCLNGLFMQMSICAYPCSLLLSAGRVRLERVFQPQSHT